MTTDVRPVAPSFTADASIGVSRDAPPRWHSAVAFALLALHGALAWVTRAFGITTHDEADYVMLGRQLRHLRYVDQYTVGSPAHSHYPPGYPTALAILSLPFGEHVGLYIAANIGASILALWLFYRLLHMRFSAAIALVGLGMAALNPGIIQYAGRPLSEVPYMLLTMIALWAAGRADDTETTDSARSSKWAILAGGAAILAALTRSIGVAILGAVFLDWLLARKYRRALVLLAASAATVGGWFVWVAVAPAEGSAPSYVADWMFTPRRHSGAVSMLVQRVTGNLTAYLTEHLPSVLPQPGLAGTKIDNAVNLILFVIPAAVGVWLFWKSSRLTVLYLGAYAAELIAFSFSEPRFLIPVVPLLLAVALLGAVHLMRPSRWLRWVPVALAGSILATATVAMAERVQDALRCDRSSSTTSPACYSADDRGLFAAMRFMRDSLPKDALIFTPENALVGYYSDRHTLHTRTIPSADPKAVETSLRAVGARYILLSSRNTPRAVRLAVWTERCADVTLVKRFVGGTLLLYLPADEGALPQSNACGEISEYAAAARPPTP